MKKFTDYIYISIASVIGALVVYLFMVPNNFAVGGVSALAIVLEKVIPFEVSVGTIVTVVNIVLLSLGYLLIGKDFSIKSTY